MPNWNSNRVKIHASKREVLKYLTDKNSAGYRMFNMHRLYPEIFPSSDPTGEEGYNQNWAIISTGTKWFPNIYDVFEHDEGGGTLLGYDTAWGPNNKLLQRFHEVTGWYIENEYEEPDMNFEGTFICDRGSCSDEVRDYHPVCEICEQKTHPDKIIEQDDFTICKECFETKPDKKD